MIDEEDLYLIQAAQIFATQKREWQAMLTGEFSPEILSLSLEIEE